MSRNEIQLRILQGKTFPLGFGIRLTPTLPKGRKIAIVLQFIACSAYVIYMIIAGPFLIFHRSGGLQTFHYHLLFSIFVLCSSYHHEHATGTVVQDNEESRKDPTFKSLQLQKSAEALSESVVQFSIQLTFLSVFTWIAQAQVKHLKSLFYSFAQS